MLNSESSLRQHVWRSPSQFTTTTVLIGLSWFWAAHQMFYAEGSGEHDTFMMVAGIVHGLHTHSAINAMDYDPPLQFAFYYISNFLVREMPANTSQVLYALNLLGTLLALCIPVLLLSFLKRFFGQILSPPLASLLLITSPAYLFTLPYGHPFHFAFTVSLLSFYLLFSSFQVARVSVRMTLILASAVLQGFALTLRLEQVVLFWGCILALLIYAKERDLFKWFSVLTVVSTALAIYFGSSRILIGPGVSVPRMATARDYGIGTYQGRILLWSMPYEVTGLGLPIIGLALAGLVTCLIKKSKWHLAFGLLLSVGPTLALYLGNPSPPRHFIVTVIALSLFVAIFFKSSRYVVVVGTAVLAAVVGLFTPSVFYVVERAAGVQGRKTHTYDVLERHGRNKSQIAAALPFYERLLTQARTNTIVFGNWIHIAEMSMLIANDEGVSFRATEIGEGLQVKEVKYRGKTIYLVEVYETEELQRMIRRLKNSTSKYWCVSLLKEHWPNDLDVAIPDELNWWTS